MSLPALLDLNHSHSLQLAEESCFCTVGMTQVAAVGHSGHHYIVNPEGRGPLRFVDYDDEEGTGEVFALDARWPVFFLFHQSGDSHTRKSLQGQDSVLLAEAAALGVDLAPLLPALLSGRLPLHEAYAAVDAGSPLAEFLRLVAAEADREAFGALLDAHPWYGAPMRHLIAHQQMDAGRWAAFLYRNLRWDLGDSRLIYAFPKAAASLLVDPSFRDDPLVPLLRRIAQDPDGYWRGAEGYFEAGQAWEEAGERDRAWACYHNAIWLERGETEEFHAEAWERLQGL